MAKDKHKKPGKRRTWLSIAAVVVFGLFVYAALKTSRLGYESPDYEVVEKDGKLELRNYTAMSTVSTPMKKAGASRQSGMDGGFGRLFKYITGKNEGGEKVAMTTPVLIDESKDGETASMNFVLPKEVASAGAPAPTADNVSLNSFEGGNFATIRFRGFRDGKAIDSAEAQLKDWIKSKGWSEQGDVLLAFYDPPWTPEFLRRNEVLIRVER